MLPYFLMMANTLFLMSVFGLMLNSQNLIILMMAMELMLLAINMNALSYAYMTEDLMGPILSLLILTVAAAESAMGLAMLMAFYSMSGTMAMYFTHLMRG